MTTSTILKFFGIAIFLFALYYLRDIVLVVILSIVVASAIEPGTKWLVRRNVPRLLAVILMYLILVIGLISVLYFLLLPILSETANFLSSLPSYLGDLKVWNPIESS